MFMYVYVCMKCVFCIYISRFLTVYAYLLSCQLVGTVFLYVYVILSVNVSVDI